MSSGIRRLHRDYFCLFGNVEFHAHAPVKRQKRSPVLLGLRLESDDNSARQIREFGQPQIGVAIRR